MFLGLHAAIIRLIPLIHEGEQRYKLYIVGDPRMVSLLRPPPPRLKNPGYAHAPSKLSKYVICQGFSKNRRLTNQTICKFN